MFKQDALNFLFFHSTFKLSYIYGYLSIYIKYLLIINHKETNFEIHVHTYNLAAIKDKAYLYKVK